MAIMHAHIGDTYMYMWASLYTTLMNDELPPLLHACMCTTIQYMKHCMQGQIHSQTYLVYSENEYDQQDNP